LQILHILLPECFTPRSGQEPTFTLLTPTTVTKSATDTISGIFAAFDIYGGPVFDDSEVYPLVVLPHVSASIIFAYQPKRAYLLVALRYGENQL
jgi:hypothetical protein